MSGRYDERDLFYVFGRSENVGHEHVRPPTLHPPTAEELAQDALADAEWARSSQAAEEAWHDGVCCGAERPAGCARCPLIGKGCYDHPDGARSAARTWELLSEVTGEMSPWERAEAFNRWVAELDSLCASDVNNNLGDEPCPT